MNQAFAVHFSDEYHLAISEEEARRLCMSKIIAAIVAETLSPLPPENPPHIVGLCNHANWHPIKHYCLDCHITRETLFFKPQIREAWKGN